MLPDTPWFRVARHALVLLTIALAGVATLASAQRVPAATDTRNSLLREAWSGLLPRQVPAPELAAQHRCLDLPGAADLDGQFPGPRGDSLVSEACAVVEYRVLDSVAGARWVEARYARTAVFTAADSSRGIGARDTLTAGETVLLERRRPGQVRAVWHERYENDAFGIWRLITAEVAPMDRGATLLSVEYCLNGTGGCSQEFLARRPDGGWFPVWQVWHDQLPAGFLERLQHGARIDPRTLRGDAGFYGPSDANCCPSGRLLVTLRLRGDSLVLIGHSVAPQ